MTMLSFHPVKAVTSAEGGIVTTGDPELRDRLLSFRNHGLVRDPEKLRERDQGGWYYEQQELGFNYRLSDVHSALGRSQMGKLDRFIEARNAIAERYREWLAEVEQLELAPAAPSGSLHAYHLFVVRHREGAAARRRLYDGLREREILAQVHHVPVHLHPWYRDRYGYGPGLCPEAESYYAGCLSLPCFPDLSEADQRRVVEAVKELV
jgi:dTDP-4-amino-4,6-dideoxygalactose transaminase